MTIRAQLLVIQPAGEARRAVRHLRRINEGNREAVRHLHEDNDLVRRDKMTNIRTAICVGHLHIHLMPSRCG